MMQSCPTKKKTTVKIFIRQNFFCDDGECTLKSKMQKGDPFKQFIGVFNEYRNCATHEGEYWEFCFSRGDGDPVYLIVEINLETFSYKNKKEHRFQTTISYKDFEGIFVRACINFINCYIEECKQK